MSAKERTGKRCLAYSRWHREQGRELAAIDIDFVEYCVYCNEPLALVETTRDVGQGYKATTVTQALAQKAGLEVWLVYYSVEGEEGKEKVTRVRVQRVYPGKTKIVFATPEQWRVRLLKMRSEHYKACVKFPKR